MESLLEAGADTRYVAFHCTSVLVSEITLCRIKDKDGDTALDLVPESDTHIISLMRKARAQASFSADDIADG